MERAIQGGETQFGAAGRLAPFRGLACAWGLLSCLSGAGQAEALELRVAQSPTWSLPWGRVEAGRVLGGIHHDMAVAVAKRLGWKLRYVPLPPNRKDYADDDRGVDLRCDLDPSWTRKPEAYHWSEPLFDTGDVLIGAAQSERLNSLSELPKGAVVGVVRGYRYPTLEARFAQGHWLREEAADQGAVLKKLARQRSSHAVVSRQALAWHQRHYPGQRVGRWTVTVQQSAHYCAVPQSSPRAAADILGAVHALHREGEVARIVARYAP
jgi:polar amino acid transport system substrate-binding protein